MSEENNQTVDNSEQTVDKSQQSVDNSQQSVDNSQQSVDNSQQSVDNSKQSVDNSKQSVDNSQQSVDNFNAEDYINGLDPEDNKQPDVAQLQEQLQLATQQRDALKDAYLKLKKTGVTVVSNPQTNTSGFNQKSVDETAQAMLDKYLNH